MDKYEQLNKIINESNHIVFFGGAGVSTESGIPDFRSKDGLYNQHDVNFDQYSPEYLLSHTCLYQDTEVFYEYYRQKMDTRHIAPNKAHYILAKLEEIGKLDCVITQNIDGLHQKAGSKVVYELHGTTLENYCDHCRKEYPSDYIFKTKGVPHCECGGMIRPRVVLYEEGLPIPPVEKSIHALKKADCLIVGGTSLSVYPAASFLDYFHGKYIIVINKDTVGKSFKNALVFNDSISKVLEKIEVIDDAR